MTTTAAPHSALDALDGADVATADQLTCQSLLAHLRRLRGYADSYEARILRRTRELAETGESFGPDDTTTRCSGVSSRSAKTRTARADALQHADGFDAALAAGEVTAEHVDQLAKVATAMTEELRGKLFDRSADLLEHACAHDPSRFGRHLRDLVRNLEHDAKFSRDERQRAATHLSWKVAADGMYDVHARLHPVLGNRLVRALDAEVARRIAAGRANGDRECIERTVNRGRLAAEALVDLVANGRPIHRPVVAEVSVLIDAATLASGECHEHTVCEDANGAPLPIAAVQALLCSGVITPIMLDTTGTALALGRSQRFPNRQQRRALRAMYRTCGAYGCEVTFDRCEVHHIVEWERLGHTDLDNLIPMCSRHHHDVHQQGWQLHLAPDRTLTVTDRHGETVMVSTPDMPHPVRRARRRTEPATTGDPHSPPQPHRLAG